MQPFDNNKDIETQLLKNNRQSRFSSFTYVRPSDLDPNRALQSDTIFGRLEKAYPDKIGFYYLIFSIVFMSLNAYFTKVAGVLPVPEIAFLRSLFMMLGIYIFITRYQSDLDIGDKRYKKVVIVLCLLGFPTALSYIYGVVHIQLAEAVTVMISTPIFVSIFSWFIFAQHFKKEQLISIVLWIIGITLVMNSAISSDSASITEIPTTTPVTNEAGETIPTTPSTETETAGGNNQFKAVVICLINALLTASSSVVVKATNVKIPPIVLMTFGTLTNLVFSGILCLVTGFKVPEFDSWINVMGLGFLYFYGQFFLMKSLEHASTRVNAALINNVQILLIYIIQMIFMAEFPAFWSFVGTLFVVAACIVLASLNR